MFNCVVGERGELVSPPRSCEGQCLWWKTQGMHCSRGLVLNVLVLGVGKTPPPGNSSTWVVDFGERAIVVAHGQREMGRTGYSTPTGQRGITCTMCMV